MRRLCTLLVGLIAGSMLGAWIAGLDVATRTDQFAPMSPLACVGFVAGAVAVWRASNLAAAVTCAIGLAGLADAAVDAGDTLNRTFFGADTRVSVLTSLALVLLGIVRKWPAIAAGAIGGAAIIGFLLGVPLFYGPSPAVEMSWQAALCALLLALAVAGAEPMFDDGLSGQFARRTLPAVLGIPVASGAFATAAARAGWWEFGVAAWVMTLAAVAGLAIVVAMAVQRLAYEDRRLTELAIRDPLTGAFNRRHFLVEAELAAARALRYGESGAIAVVDLDHFKEINDRWGHAAGDQALTLVHCALRGRLRTTDVLGRIGGDEFAAVILHVDGEAAAAVAQEMREAVARVGETLRAQGLTNRLGASVGIAAFDPEHDIETLIDLADQRMYVDKRLGQKVKSGADH